MLEVNGGLVGDQLRMTIAFDRQVHNEEAIGWLGRRLVERLCRQVYSSVRGTAERPDASATDFGWSQNDVDDLK